MMLKILSPLSRKKEIPTLIQARADELFCGFVSSYTPVNDRPNKNLVVNKRFFLQENGIAELELPSCSEIDDKIFKRFVLAPKI